MCKANGIFTESVLLERFFVANHVVSKPTQHYLRGMIEKFDNE